MSITSEQIDGGFGTNLSIAFRILKVKIRGYTSGFLLLSPTENCQLNLYRGFDSFLNMNPSYKDFYEWYQTAKAGRNLLLLDINNNILEKTKKFFPEKSIISEAPYLSTNGSKMVVLIVHITPPTNE